MNLAGDEPYDADDADQHRQPDHGMRICVRFDVREAEHQPAETEDRQSDGEEIGFGGRVVHAEVT